VTNERSVRCGAARGAGLPPTKRGQLALRMWEPHANVRVKVEDVSHALWADVPDVLLDLVDLASYVYAADQAVSRGDTDDRGFGALWRRGFHFAVPVRRPDLWGSPAVREELEGTLSFLSEDEHHFHFEPLTDPPPRDRYLEFDTARFGGTVQEVMLFSGGLDSLAGAAQQAVACRRKVVLVHHRSNTKIDGVVRRLANDLREKAEGCSPVLLPVRVSKARGLSREPTQRARSFLFAALGATVAVMLGLDRVSFYENGVVGINLPLAAQVVGARASRTTHPRALAGFARLLGRLTGKPFSFDNPFLWLTKAEVVRVLADARCADLIAHTRSCAFPRAASNERPHCGECSQCIDRRFAVLAARQEAFDPESGYKVDLLTGARAAGAPQVILAVYAETASRIGRMGAAEFFRTYGEVSRLVASVKEPPGVVAQQVFRLYQRHAAEVNQVIDAAFGANGSRFRERTLPPTCLLRMVYGLDASGADAAPAPAPQDGENVFRRSGKVWEVRYRGGKRFYLRPRRGLTYIHALLQRPGSPFGALELYNLGAPRKRSPGAKKREPVVDRQTLAECRRRRAELRGEI
jgi:7-cyano-7-deazaguanine synthase in queuosine biosynthesis